MGTTFVRPQQSVSGEEELALYFIVQVQRREDEDLVSRILQESREVLSDEISILITNTLGSIYRLKKVEVRRGSVTFWVFIAGAYTLVSHYADFVSSLETMRKQIQMLLQQFLMHRGAPEVTITSGWSSISDKRISQKLVPILMDCLRVMGKAFAVVFGSTLALALVLLLFALPVLKSWSRVTQANTQVQKSQGLEVASTVIECIVWDEKGQCIETRRVRVQEMTPQLFQSDSVAGFPLVLYFRNCDKTSCLAYSGNTVLGSVSREEISKAQGTLGKPMK